MRIVFVTGATSGIGKACAEKFAEGGYNLILNGRRNDRLEELKNSLKKKYKIDVLTLPFDVQKRKEVFDSILSIPPQWQNIDVLINNAGLALGKELFDEASIDDWDTMISTNVKGLLYVTKAVLPFMTSRNKGQIINLGSVAGKEVYEKGNIYCVTKTAVEAISKSMRIDLLRHSIKVTAIHPGATAETEFAEVRFKGNKEVASQTYKGYQPLTSKDIADTIYYTASLPDHVCINDLVITCTAQADALHLFKKEW